MGTFGKALGSFGAYGTFSKEMRDYLINCCSGFIYSTALPPSVMGAVDAALDLVPEMDRERKQLMEKAGDLRAELHRMGWDTGLSATHIIPIIVGSEAETLALAGRLEDAGILAMAIRPPTVEKGRSRIRIALTALHTDQHLNRLIDALDRWKRDKRK
jgi:8-amino-7-oxononanoate synthase